MVKNIIYNLTVTLTLHWIKTRIDGDLVVLNMLMGLLS